MADPSAEMDLPSNRELELQILLKERDSHIISLSNDIRALRRQLRSQPTPAQDDPISLPSHVAGMIAPLINQTTSSTRFARDGSSQSKATVTAALTARLGALQQENDELYGLLRTSKVGKTHEEVRTLRRLVLKLETALKESHTIIQSVSTELDRAYEVIGSRGLPPISSPPRMEGSREPISRHSDDPGPSRSRTPSSGSSYRHSRSHSRSRSRSNPPRGRSRSNDTQNRSMSTLPQSPPLPVQQPNATKPLPTGPRAQKRPRQESQRPARYRKPQHLQQGRDRYSPAGRRNGHNLVSHETDPVMNVDEHHPDNNPDDEDRRATKRRRSRSRPRSRSPSRPRQHSRSRSRSREQNRERRRSPSPAPSLRNRGSVGGGRPQSPPRPHRPLPGQYRRERDRNPAGSGRPGSNNSTHPPPGKGKNGTLGRRMGGLAERIS